MRGGHKQFMHRIINFNTLCISQNNLFNFTVESVADFNYYWKMSPNTVEVFSREVELD